jgi:hypothetical protein
MTTKRHTGRNASWLGCIGLLLSWPSQSPADDAELLSIVRAGHRSARQSIHRLSATVTREITFAKPSRVVHLTGKYWRSFDVVRIQEKVGSGTEDTLLKDSEIRQVGRGTDPQGGQVRYAANRRAATQTLGMLDVWTEMIIDFPAPNARHCDFDRFLESAKQSPQASREWKDGRECVRLDLNIVFTTGNEYKVILWHDVARNYLVWKKMMLEKSTPILEAEVLEFREPLPGIFVPVKCRQQSFRDGEQDTFAITTLSEVQINKPIPGSVFQLPPIPSGTVLRDEIQRTSYPIDENWRPIGPATPLSQPMLLPDDSGKLESRYHSQSTTEPISLGRWLLSGSLVVLIAACVCLVYRHFRSRSRLQRAN